MNKKISTPLAISITIILAVAIGGIILYLNYFSFQKELSYSNLENNQNNESAGVYERKAGLVWYEQPNSKNDVVDGRIELSDIGDGKFKIKGSAYQGIIERGVHIGDVNGVISVINNTAQYKDDFCSFDLSFSNKKIVIKNDNGGCGGMNVSFNGEYLKI